VPDNGAYSRPISGFRPGHYPFCQPSIKLKRPAQFGLIGVKSNMNIPRQFVFIALALTLFASLATAQDRGRERDRGRGWGGRGGGDDDARREEMYRQMDRNKDGQITSDEVDGRMREFVGERAARYGMSKDPPWKVDELINRRRNYNGTPEGPGAAKSEPTSGVTTFGAPPTTTPVAGFGSGAAVTGINPYETKALQFIGQFDENRNGKLERDEWRRIPGEPEKADTNRDGEITIAELVARLRYKATVGGGGAVASGDKKTTVIAKPASGPKKSYRFIPAKERLPKEIPGWFTSKDRDGDGQVAMAEYSSRWSDRDAEAFARYDVNGDGFIGITEALREN